MIRIILLILIILSFGNTARADLTTHEAMIRRLEALSIYDASHHSRLRVSTIGFSVHGKSILLVQVGCHDATPQAPKKLFVLCRQHGDEPATTEAMLNLTETLTKAEDRETQDLLSKVTLFIVPMMNPDGADLGRRKNSNNADLNRDWLALSQPETRAVHAAVDRVNPDVFLDEHEQSPGNMHKDYIESADCSCGIPAELVQRTDGLKSLITDVLARNGMPVTSYRIEESCPTKIAHRYFAICRHKISLILETTQSGARINQLGYRMNYHIIGTMTAAEYLAGHENEILANVRQHKPSLIQNAASRLTGGR